MHCGLVALGLIVALAFGAAAGEVEHLGQPCRAKQVLAGLLVKDRACGGERLVLTNMNELTHTELIFIDFKKDKAKIYKAPAGSGSWALAEVPDNRLVVGTYYDGMFMIFDLNEMVFVKAVPFPGESYIWNLAAGGDGRIYGGSYPGGKLGALDLKNYTVEDCGAPAPPNLYLRNVSSTPDGRIFCSLGTEKPGSFLYDPKTKKWEASPAALKGISTGVSWQGHFLAGAAAFKGPLFERVDPPCPLPPKEKGGWAVLNDLTRDDVLYLQQGSSIYRFKAGDKQLGLIADVDLRGGRMMAVSGQGELLGVRGQDYFVIKPGDTKLDPKPIPVVSGPRPLHFIKADDQGRIWGGPLFGQTLCWIDSRTKEAVNTSAICDAGGEVYDVAFWGGKVYAAAYSGGDIIEYDPAKPWDQIGGQNPRLLSDVGGRGYIRPIAGIQLGPDGRLYSGWMAKYGTYGGAIAITDIKTGKSDLMENPLGQQAISGLAVDNEYAYVGTSLGANGLNPKTGESPSFGMIDLKTGKVVFKHTFDGVGSVGNCAYDIRTKRAAFIAGGKMYAFDTIKRKLVEDLYKDIPPPSCRRLVALGDGKLWYGSGKSLVLLDIKTGKFEIKAKLPEDISDLSATKNASYASCGPDVYRISFSDK